MQERRQRPSAPARHERTGFLDAGAAARAELDPDRCPYTRSVAEQLRKHDNRAEFVVGIDLIFNGITARQ
ncbi:hypothetical protein ACWDZ8_25670 [Streptomyces sp. NPDC003233]